MDVAISIDRKPSYLLTSKEAIIFSFVDFYRIVDNDSNFF